MKEKARVEEHTSLFNEQALSLERLLNELQYPDHIEKAVKEKLEKPDIAEIASIAYSGEGFDYPLCKRMPLTRLAVVTWLLQKTYGEYKAIGVADDIIFETFRDVTHRGFLRLCVFPFGSVYITLNACNSKSFLQYKPKYSTQIFGLGIVYFMPLRRG